MFRAMEDIINEKQRSSPVNDDNDSEDNTELLPSHLDSNGIPVNWCKVRNSQQAPYILVQLKAGQLEYEKISAEFLRENIKVAKIERLQNPIHLVRFNSEVEEIRKTHTQDCNPNIHYLYHGTCVKKSKICEEGLDQRLSRMGHFGKGIYFSDSPMKCLYYTEFANQPDNAIILKCRVILGDCKIFEPGCFDPNLTREPEKENPAGGYRYYDSVMCCPKDFNEYVVYENRRVMVEYIISFTVDEKMKKSVEPMSMVDSSSQEGEKNKKSRGKAWKYIAVGLGVGSIGFVATPLIATAALGAVGFTAGGVAAGSIAAAIQATIGNVAAGSAFALAQSAGATGIVSGVTQLAGGTLLGTASAAIMKLWKRRPTKENKYDKNK